MKKLEGTVTSTKMEKTVVIEVVRIKTHSFYKKRMRVKKKFHAHDEIGVKEGDRVLIQECRPVSKTKKWKVIKVLGRRSQ